MLTDHRASAPARPVDARALQRIAARVARQPDVPWLHREVARRMAEKLAWIKRRPATIVDWGAQAGGSADLLSRSYPAARILPVESCGVEPAETSAMPWWRRLQRKAPRPVPPGECPDASAELVWSNMALHHAADIAAVFREWRRITVVDGFLMFSTLGPGSLGLLRDVYRDARWGPPLAPLVDMHDLGDLLVESGFADPVMDQETLSVTWAQPEALLHDLRALGGNAATDRHVGLRTPRWRRALCDALEARRDLSGRIALSLEVVYGHAFRPSPRVRGAETTTIPLEQMRAMARGSRGRS
ncbi:MAG: methyltransferase domain-containing protein [Rubrivivax sp.]|nr:methyltransferase domain-containing protein [Rubrivivax sp.]